MSTEKQRITLAIHRAICEDSIEECLDDYGSCVKAAEATAEPSTAILAFINERPGFITAMKNTKGTDNSADYWRWSGHAEARRQLATVFGYTVPHNPSDTTKKVTP